MLKEILTKKNIFLLIIFTVLLATSMFLFNPIFGSKQTYAADKSSGTPSFIKVGQTYQADQGYDITILEIYESGWVLANHKAYGKGYFNINHFQMLTLKSKS